MSAEGRATRRHGDAAQSSVAFGKKAAHRAASSRRATTRAAALRSSASVNCAVSCSRAARRCSGPAPAPAARFRQHARTHGDTLLQLRSSDHGAYERALAKRAAAAVSASSQLKRWRGVPIATTTAVLPPVAEPPAPTEAPAGEGRDPASLHDVSVAPRRVVRRAAGASHEPSPSCASPSHEPRACNLPRAPSGARSRASRPRGSRLSRAWQFALHGARAAVPTARSRRGRAPPTADLEASGAGRGTSSAALQSYLAPRRHPSRDAPASSARRRQGSALRATATYQRTSAVAAAVARSSRRRLRDQRDALRRKSTLGASRVVTGCYGERRAAEPAMAARRRRAASRRGRRRRGFGRGRSRMLGATSTRLTKAPGAHLEAPSAGARRRRAVASSAQHLGSPSAAARRIEETGRCRRLAPAHRDRRALRARRSTSAARSSRTSAPATPSGAPTPRHAHVAAALRRAPPVSVHARLRDGPRAAKARPRKAPTAGRRAERTRRCWRWAARVSPPSSSAPTAARNSNGARRRRVEAYCHARARLGVERPIKLKPHVGREVRVLAHGA